VVVSSNTTLVITTYRDGWFDSTASHQFFMGCLSFLPTMDRKEMVIADGCRKRFLLLEN